MKNTGKEYELFVAKLQQALLDAETIASQKNIQVEVNRIILDNCEIERQFDIYWEYELGGITYKTAIECKDYNSSISVEKIDALIGKVRDIPNLRAVFATKKGYQSGAKKKADQNGIELLIVREQNDTDWTSEDGTPLIKKVNIGMHLLMPPEIRNFEPMIDGAWLKENTSRDPAEPIVFSGLTTEIFIEDVKKGAKYSLYDLAHTLEPFGDGRHGVFQKTETLDDAFFCHGSERYKLGGYRIEYVIFEPATQTIEMDFSKELIGVVEYLQKGKKKSIFKNGIIK